MTDAVPFRITRYSGGFGEDATEVVEDESIVSSEEITRALPRPGTYTFDWNQSVFLDEMSDGRILNVVVVSERRLFGTRREALARERNEHLPASAMGQDTYLATTRNGDLVKIEVSVEPAPAQRLDPSE